MSLGEFAQEPTNLGTGTQQLGIGRERHTGREQVMNAKTVDERVHHVDAFKVDHHRLRRLTSWHIVFIARDGEELFVALAQEHQVLQVHSCGAQSDARE